MVRRRTESLRTAVIPVSTKCPKAASCPFDEKDPKGKGVRQQEIPDSIYGFEFEQGGLAVEPRDG